MIGAAVRLSKASRRTRRFVLVAEVAVVAIGVFYTILLGLRTSLRGCPGTPNRTDLAVASNCGVN